MNTLNKLKAILSFGYVLSGDYVISDPMDDNSGYRFQGDNLDTLVDTAYEHLTPEHLEIESGELSASQVAKWIATHSTEDLNDVLIANHDCMISKWLGDDIRGQHGDDNKIHLKKSQVKSILTKMKKIDCNIGINWDAIGYLIDDELKS